MTLTKHNEFCIYKKDTKTFWRKYLNDDNVNLGQTIISLVKKVLVTPIGSADAERTFSLLSHARHKRRSRLTPAHMEDIIRIRFDGPKDLKLFPAMQYAEAWHLAGKYLSDDDKTTAEAIDEMPSMTEEDWEELQGKIFLESDLF